jgi:tartrate-resistant acid phosphatase type 5
MASVALLVSALLLLSPAEAELQRVQHAPKEDGSLTVLAVGDWGRGGQYNQTLVAEQV